VLYNSWPMADRAFDVCSINNFVANDLPRVWGLAMNANLSDRVKRRVLSMLNCDRIILPPDPTSIFASDTLDPIRLAILDEPMPRAYVVGGVSVVENKDAVLRGLASHEFDPWETAMIDRGAVPDDSLADLRSGRVTHRLVRLDYRPNSLEIEIDSGAAGLLVVSDSYFPGWVATMNGKKVPIYRVNLGFRGVRVPAGKSVVNMTYAPVSVPVGIAVSLVTVVAVVLVAAPRPRAGTRPSGRNPAS